MTSNTINYERIASQYARHRSLHPIVLERLCGRVDNTSRVLEVGCGTGNYIAALAELKGCSCWGIDPSERMLAIAGKRSNRVQLLRGLAERMPFGDRAFDLVFSVDVIHHVKDLPAHLREARRVIEYGGILCTVTDSEWIIRHRPILSGYFPETVAAELKRYPGISELRSAMEYAGFTGITEEMVEYRGELTNLQPYRDKAYSSLHLIPEQAFSQGLERLERDLATGPIPYTSRYLMLWGQC